MQWIALLQNAVDHYRGGRLHQAEVICREVLAEQPDKPEALHLLGVIALAARQYSDAVHLIRRAIELAVPCADYYNNL